MISDKRPRCPKINRKESHVFRSDHHDSTGSSLDSKLSPSTLGKVGVPSKTYMDNRVVRGFAGPQTK